MGEGSVRNYSTDRVFSDRFIPAIKRIVGPLLLTEAGDFEDQREATDLVVLKLRKVDVRIACRVRTPEFKRFRDEFTFRLRRASGVTTELQKILGGFGDFAFYGHATGPTLEIDPWVYLDLAKFREIFKATGWREGVARGVLGERVNGDGVTAFAWFKIAAFAECVVARSPGFIVGLPVVQKTFEWSP